MTIKIEKFGVTNNLPKSLVSDVMHNVGNLHKQVSKMPPAKLLELAKFDFSIILVCQDHGHRCGIRSNFTETLQGWYGNDFTTRENDFPFPLSEIQTQMIEFLCGEIYDKLIVLSPDTLQTFRDQYPTIFMMASVYSIRHQMNTLETV